MTMAARVFRHCRRHKGMLNQSQGWPELDTFKQDTAQTVLLNRVIERLDVRTANPNITPCFGLQISSD